MFPYKALEKFSKTLYGNTGGTYSARNSAEKEHLQSTIPPNFQDLKTTRTRHSACASKILQAKNILQTLAFNTYINFPYILNINQSTASGVETVQVKGRAKSLLVIRRKSRRKKV